MRVSWLTSDCVFDCVCLCLSPLRTQLTLWWGKNAMTNSNCLAWTCTFVPCPCRMLKDKLYLLRIASLSRCVYLERKYNVPFAHFVQPRGAEACPLPPVNKRLFANPFTLVAFNCLLPNKSPLPYFPPSPPPHPPPLCVLLPERWQGKLLLDVTNGHTDCAASEQIANVLTNRLTDLNIE